jgi:hypothetical protein
MTRVHLLGAEVLILDRRELRTPSALPLSSAVSVVVAWIALLRPTPIPTPTTWYWLLGFSKTFGDQRDKRGSDWRFRLGMGGLALDAKSVSTTALKSLEFCVSIVSCSQLKGIPQSQGRRVARVLGNARLQRRHERQKEMQKKDLSGAKREGVSKVSSLKGYGLTLATIMVNKQPKCRV